MNYDLELQIRKTLGQYLRGHVTLRYLHRWLAPRLWDIEKTATDAARHIGYGAELLIAEHANGDWTDNELKVRLAKLLEVPFAITHESNDIEDVVESGLILYARMREVEPHSFEEAKTLYENLLSWHHDTVLVIRAIENCENNGGYISLANDLQDAFAEVNSFVEKLKGRIEALNSFIAGEGIPGDSFIDDL